MKLRGKFSSLLSACVVAAVFLTTLAITRFFATEKESFIVEFQTNRAGFLEHRLTEKFNLLHSQAKAVLSEKEPLKRILEALPAVAGGELWDDEKLVSAHPALTQPFPPPHGLTEWSFWSAARVGGVPTVKWIGRYGKLTLVLALQSEWFDDIFHAERGAAVQLVHPDGDVLVQSKAGNDTSGSFYSAEIYQRMGNRLRGGSETLKYKSESGSELVGTFLSLETEPPVLITLHTSTATITSSIRRTYQVTAGIALIFLIATIAIGMVFASSLTKPLRALDLQTRDIAQGKFDIPALHNAGRSDEVGSLTRSFARMGRDLKKTQEELQRAERLAALGKFSASIAHEIKNPLGGILINTQLAEEQLRKEPFDKKALTETLGFVREETWRADRIVKSLMKFARQEKPPLRHLDLNERVRRSLAMIKPTLDQAGVALVLDLPREPIPCRGEGDQIHEVLLNLVQNAVYAMKNMPLKQLNVKMAAQDGKVVLDIIDSGSGMTDEVKIHLFEPFYTTKPFGEGTGLGLSVCHGIIKSHGGMIEVKSEVGRGTCFSLTFPILTADIALAA